MLLKGTYKKIEPASGAIIMASGIFLIGAVEAFPTLDAYFGKYFAFALLITWVVIYKRLSVQFFHHDFLIPYLKNPINSFTIGTWIAGVSVLCNVFLKYFPSILFMTQAMAALNTVLWLFFLVNCFYNFKQLFFDYKDYPVHGVILLSTVGTQSIIVLLNNVFFQLPVLFSKIIIVFGLVFYVLGMVLISRRYVGNRNWSLADDWANTNCIIHGALSITGLAIVFTNAFSPFVVSIFWIFVCSLLIFIEGLELIRATIRIKLYGWNQGICTYHITQWSRNFTFGMFYTFSLVMHKNPFYLIPDKLYNFQIQFLSFWAWVVWIALLGQILLYVKSRFEAKGILQ